MEPVTHLLTGACLARTGLNRRAAYATAAMAVAAEFPDIDTVWSLRGPVAGFEHHRGITHTFLGIPFEAGLLLFGFYLVHQLRMRNGSRSGGVSTGSSYRGTGAPVRWGLLYLFLLLALLSHLLLDYTNNYGIRPFFPFNAHWYAGSIVFIFDPLLFLLLVAGLTLPAFFGLISKEIGARPERFRGRGWARAALFGVLLLWTARWFEHGRAVVFAQNQVLRAPGVVPPDTISVSVDAKAEGSGQTGPVSDAARPLLVAQRSLASPDPLSIFRWYTATDFGSVRRIGVADTRTGSLVPGALFAEPQPDPELANAERTHLGRVYLDWSPMPIVTSEPDLREGEDLEPGDGKGSTTVIFSDPRFMGDIPLLRSSKPPLTGEVILDARGQPIAEGMDGRFGR